MVAARKLSSGVLIVNPNAGRLSARGLVEDVVAEAQEGAGLDVVFTSTRNAATGIARRAVEEGAEIVIAYGGDGHVNEVANGLAETPASLGIIPGGTMNVFARALGIPTDPHAALAHVIAHAEREPRLVNLGKMDDRYFTFSAGCGFDAEAAELVEQHLYAKRRVGEMFFYWSAFRVLAGSFRHRSPRMRLKGPFGEVPVAMAIACNTGPYAYFAGRPVRITPAVRLEGGLDVFALTSIRVEAVPLYFWRVLIAGEFASHPDAFYESNLETFDVIGERPFSRHVDGEPLPSADQARFEIAREVLRVVA